jgi:twitching motility protein PilT
MNQTNTLGYTLPQLLKALLDQKGSDLHVTAHSPPRLRINGQLLPLDLPAVNETQSLQLCYSILTEEQKKKFEMDQELDIAFTVKGLCRFRANIFMQKNSVGGVFRMISNQFLTIKDLGLPPVLQELCHQPRGLILVTGPTGSGKSTTLAAMIDYINTNFTYHIMTIEDPVEFVHQNKKSIINQREVGADTKNFANALKSCLRQDPNVVLVGELRDYETISMALTTAETGHLVFASLHTNTAIASINRLIDVFPPHQQTQIRTQISFSLVAVVTQILIPNVAGGRALCSETMILNSAIRNLIREDKIHQIYSAMQIGQEESRMKTMNQSLLELVLRKKVNPEEALSKSPDPMELMDLIQKTPGAGYLLKKLK